MQIYKLKTPNSISNPYENLETKKYLVTASILDQGHKRLILVQIGIRNFITV